MGNAQQLRKVSSRQVFEQEACDPPAWIRRYAHAVKKYNSWQGPAVHQNPGLFQDIETLLKRLGHHFLQFKIVVVVHSSVNVRLRLYIGPTDNLQTQQKQSRLHALRLQTASVKIGQGSTTPHNPT